MIRKKTFIFLVLSILLSGCSATREYYSNNEEKNITVEIKTDLKEGFFSSVEISAGINDVNKDCSTKYKGMVELKSGKNKLGLKNGKLTFLAIEVFQKDSLQYSTASSIRGTLLKPMRGMKYNVVVKYIDGMFDLQVFEIRNNKRKRLDIVPMEACKPSNLTSK